MTWRVCLALCVSLGLDCSPNLVLGTRERDAAVFDAQPAALGDAGPGDATEPMPDAGPAREAGQAAQAVLDAGTTMQPQMETDAAVACTSSDQCRDPDERLCDLAEGRCVECLSDADCADNEQCESDQECGARPVPCTSAVQCIVSDEPVCHETERVCVECASDADCPRLERCQPDYECD